jgi:N-acetylglucosamine-6-phosphate deacetylase
MNSGELCARLVPTGVPVQVRWTDGLLSKIASVPDEVAESRWVAPSLLDLQINGFAGVDFQQDELSESDLLRAVAGLRAAGCVRFLFTVTTDAWDTMMARFCRARALRVASPALTAAIAGWHFEGPFLSSESGFCGAHNPDRMLDPTVEHIRELRSLTGTDPVLVTLAPERKGALEAISLAVVLGMHVSLGHTNASAERLQQAVRAGASGFTHFGNACPQQLDRHDNILWRVLDTTGLTLSLIPDGIHVSPPLLRTVHRLVPDRGLYYTTDAVAPAGAPPGTYTVGEHRVAVGPDQIVRQPGCTSYAGSALEPIEGVCRAAAMLRRPWQSIWDLLSSNPARFMGWPQPLAIGQPANLCLLRVSSDGNPFTEKTFLNGA